MYTAYEVDYHDRCHKLGSTEKLEDAVRLERKALKESGGEFPTFTEDGKRCVTNNGRRI